MDKQGEKEFVDLYRGYADVKVHMGVGVEKCSWGLSISNSGG